MPTKEELQERYRNYSLEEFYELAQTIEEYSEEAQEAFNMVLEEMGGKDELVSKMEQQVKVQKEERRIKSEIDTKLSEGLDQEAIFQSISTEILGKDRLQELLEEGKDQYQLEKKDKNISSKTIFGGLLGLVSGTLFSGTILGMIMVNTGKLMLFLLVIPTVINFGFIYLFTQQSYKNVMVLILVIVGTFLSFFLSSAIFDYMGYQGPEEF